MIPYSRQDIDEEDIQAVVEVLRSDYLTQGPVVPAFEKSITDYCAVNYAVAVNSATSALHVACLALGVSKGDIVWTSPITFVASANCALYCGADIDFVDIDSKTYNMSVNCLSEKLQQAEILGKLPKVVIPVHLCGQPCDMERIYALSLKYKFKIIEDASHAIGAKYQNQSVGNCAFSDITIFSFHPVKIITTGEGGMATTNDKSIANKMRLFRSHGITRDPLEMQHEPDGPWYYEQVELGFNYRITDLQAALGLSQMQRLDNFVKQRQSIAKKYDELLSVLPVLLPFQLESSRSAFHLYVIRLKAKEKSKTHKEIFEKIRQLGIGVNLHYMPVYNQPYYQKIGFKRNYCIEADSYYKEAISLPIYPALSDMKQIQVVNALKESLLE
jgi:UDP-4-amino-4,6-dideoxy-N-acetyl-beta-L-altrosamine transaminase